MNNEITNTTAFFIVLIGSWSLLSSFLNHIDLKNAFFIQKYDMYTQTGEVEEEYVEEDIVKIEIPPKKFKLFW